MKRRSDNPLVVAKSNDKGLTESIFEGTLNRGSLDNSKLVLEEANHTPLFPSPAKINSDDIKCFSLIIFIFILLTYFVTIETWRLIF